MSAIDLNRGVTIRLHRQGFRVCMYKDAPGLYFDSSGRELPAAVAAQAGFDVDTDAREARKRKAIDEARARIEREFAEKEQAVTDLLNASGDDTRFIVKHTGGGRYAIFDEAGTRLTEKAMSQEEAGALLKELNLPAAGNLGNEGEHHEEAGSTSS